MVRYFALVASWTAAFSSPRSNKLLDAQLGRLLAAFQVELEGSHQRGDRRVGGPQVDLTTFAQVLGDEGGVVAPGHLAVRAPAPERRLMDDALLLRVVAQTASAELLDAADRGQLFTTGSCSTSSRQ